MAQKCSFVKNLNSELETYFKRTRKTYKDKHIENKSISISLKEDSKNLDYVMQDLHDAEFKKTDCLKCANCCKTTGPLFTSADIERVSKYLKQKPQQFIEQYLRIDEDQDYVLQSVPCNFLDNENACMIMRLDQRHVVNFHTPIERNFNKFQTLL
jgi:hypothetical protein